MSRLHVITAVVAAVAIACATTTSQAEPPTKSKKEPKLETPSTTSLEHQRLTAMVGTWDVELTFWFKPGAPAATTKGTSTIQSLFDGLFVEEKIEGRLMGTPFTTLAWTGFNPTTHLYEATRIASTNPARIVETGGYDENAKRFELKADYPLAGDTWHQRTVIQPSSADSMIATSYLSFGKVPEWKAVEIKYRRRAK